MLWDTRTCESVIVCDRVRVFGKEKIGKISEVQLSTGHSTVVQDPILPSLYEYLSSRWAKYRA